MYFEIIFTNATLLFFQNSIDYFPTYFFLPEEL